MTVPARRYLSVLIATTLGLSVVAASRVLDSQLTFTTGVVFLGAVATTALLITEIALAAAATSRETRIKVRVLWGTCTALLFGLEVFFRFGLGTHLNYLERNGDPVYHSAFAGSRPTWFHVYLPQSTREEERPEFSSYRSINSLGLAEREIPVERSANEYRILAVGDSFTEGQGTTYDSAWVRVVERELADHAPDRFVRTINAGISGSDVFYAYVLVRDHLADLDPDLVILAVNNSDVNDVMVRGGMERFHDNGHTVFSAQPPSWEWLYGISFIARTVVRDVLGYDWRLMSPDDTMARTRLAIEQIPVAVRQLAELSEERGFHLVVATHPHEWEVRSDEYSADGFATIVDELSTIPNAHFVDVLDGFRRAGVTEATVRDYYWPIDAHHNGRGYDVMGRIIAEAIVASQFLDRP